VRCVAAVLVVGACAPAGRRRARRASRRRLQRDVRQAGDLASVCSSSTSARARPARASGCSGCRRAKPGSAATRSCSAGCASSCTSRAGNEVVELLAGVQLGHRDEEVVVEAFEEVAEGDAAEDLLVLEVGEDLAREERRADDELVVDRTGERQLDAVDLARGGCGDSSLSASTAARPRAALPSPSARDTCSRRARSAPRSCRCSTSPCRGGCAARAWRASARTRGGRRRRRSRRRAGPACGA
jgi:hypothetical protein